jgi:hypothetical protein
MENWYGSETNSRAEQTGSTESRDHAAVAGRASLARDR